jgi:hypothetical protein
MVDTVRTTTELLTTLFQDGQSNGAITAQDMRDLVVSVKDPAAVVEINALADFPTPVSGVITLVTGKTYMINGAIDIGVNRIDASAGAIGIFGRSSEVISLTTNNVAAMITSDETLTIMHCSLTNTGGPCFNLGAAGKFYRFDDITLNSAGVDSITNGIAAVFTNTRWSGGAAGVTISGAWTAILFRSCGFFSLTGTPTMMTMASGTTPNIFNVDGTQFLTAAGQTGIDIDSAINPATSGQFSNCTFAAAGTPLDAGGIDESSTGWTFKDNTGTPNTRVGGWTNHAESINIVSNKLAIVEDARTQLTIDGLASGTNTTYAPLSGSIWNTSTNKITPATSGNCYDIRLQITASYDAGLQAHIDLEIDIGGALGVVFAEHKIFVKGANLDNQFSWSIPIFTLGTFITNGGTIYLTPRDSDIKIWDAKLFITQTFEPDLG